MDGNQCNAFFNRYILSNPNLKTNPIEPEKEEAKEETKTQLSFMRKFIELQALMLHHNSQLTKSHPYSSAPITWPFVIRGISFWETSEGLKQIYLLGNPFAWFAFWSFNIRWLAIIGPLLYAVMWVIDRLFLQRGIDDFGIPVRKWWDRALGFQLLAWY
jgi:dolichyl-phosphate-mannose-protein mannosyltransferase